MKTVAVVGAGITGIMAAYYLAKEGYDVTVYDEEKYPAMKTSYANGGQISVSNSEVWNTTKNIKKGVQWMFQQDAPLYIRPTFEWAKIKWLTKFLYHTVIGSYTQNTHTSINLGLESRELYQQIRDEEKVKYDFSDCGILHFYKNETDFFDAQQSAKVYKFAGAEKEWELISTDKICKLEPTLNTKSIVGGVWTPNDATGDIHVFCTEMKKILEEKYKVKFTFGLKIENVGELPFDNIIISNGVGAVKLAKSINDSLPIYPVKGYSITINLDEESQKHAPLVSLLDDHAKIVTSRLGNKLRVAGTAELDGENYDIRRNRIEPLLNWVHENFPNINTHDYSSWACLRPMTPDMIPIIKQSKKNPKVFYHCGHGHLGWTYSPATAKQLVNLLKGN